jgi:hypothetical protein
MILEDMSGVETTVMLKGDVTNEPRQVKLNTPTEGADYLTNDVSRTMLKVVLEDVPSSPTYRGQQLNAMSEVFKSTPSEFQRALFPQMLALMDVPHRDAAIKAIRDASVQPTEEQITQRIEQAVHEALMKSDADYNAKVLIEDARVNDAKIDKLRAEAIATGTTAAFEAMQAAGVVIAAPQAAPVADEIMRGAGYVPSNPAGVSPGIAAVAPVTAGVNPVSPSVGTHPNMPISPAAGVGAGIETPENEGI